MRLKISYGIIVALLLCNMRLQSQSLKMPGIKPFFEGCPKAVLPKSVRGRSFQVRNINELVAVASKVNDGDIVYLSKAEFDASQLSTIEFTKRVTIIGTYDIAKKKGSTIVTARLGHQPVLKLSAAGSRFLKIRMTGPDTTRRYEQMQALLRKGAYYSIPNSRAITIAGDNSQIWNCEFSGWSEAAIYIEGAKNVEVFSNYIHHNQRDGLGYGVCLNKSTATINYNYFDWNRHDIAGTGRAGTSFSAQYNVVGPNKYSHSFDMHKIMDESLKKEIAGDTIIIRNNWVYVKDQEFVRISGEARFDVEIEGNYMVDDSPSKILIKGHTNKARVKNAKLRNNSWLTQLKSNK